MSVKAPDVCPCCGSTIERSGLPLTKQQYAMVHYIDAYLHRCGYAPTLQEIADHFELRSLATVHEQLGNLERKGAIRRERHMSRAIRVLYPTG